MLAFTILTGGMHNDSNLTTDTHNDSSLTPDKDNVFVLKITISWHTPLLFPRFHSASTGLLLRCQIILIVETEILHSQLLAQ